MRKILPFLFSIFLIHFFAVGAFAQSPIPNPSVVPSQPVIVPTQAPTQAVDPTAPSEGTWVNDPEVTFVGKVGARSGQFLDWTLKNYRWSEVKPGAQNPLQKYWSDIRNIVYAFFTLFVLVTAFIIIISRGRNITIYKFIPRFIGIVLLVTLSFAIIQFIYQVTDVIQGFFFKVPGTSKIISQENLLNIAFNYQDFTGYRRLGGAFDESAYVTLLLVKLTAATYYVMSGVLLVRKIILWFFIVVSPIFPLLLLYAPVRNTGKIWIGEFFRWLLYGPLFAIFLSGLVAIWANKDVGIPLQFKGFDQVSKQVIADCISGSKDQFCTYPTATSILLGGPGQLLSLGNSVNYVDTFAQYIVALLMLWVVIILPFLLLQIFLDYIKGFAWGQSNFVAQLMSGASPVLNKIPPVSQIPPTGPPPGHQPGGLARNMPFINKISIPQIKHEQLNTQLANIKTVQADTLKLANLSLPTMRDIAKFETASLSSDITHRSQIDSYHDSLKKIANPHSAASPVERQKFIEVKDKLVKESQKGNLVATSILNAANSVSTGVVDKQKESSQLALVLKNLSNVESAPLAEKQKLMVIKEELDKQDRAGDPLAGELKDAMTKGEHGVTDDLKEKVKEAKNKGSTLAAMIMQESGMLDIKEGSNAFPVVNRVQQVSLDDYEAVKEMWVENYTKLDAPKAQTRKEWINNDIARINEVIAKLSSADPANVKKGMEAVSSILPFLLVGGFSHTEVIAYLKAKMEAAKSVLSSVEKSEADEETKLDVVAKKHEEHKMMAAEEAVKE